MSAVAKIIETLRERGGLKGTDVANIAAVSPATVSRWSGSISAFGLARENACSLANPAARRRHDESCHRSHWLGAAAGEQAFDINRFSYNPSGLALPEPGSAALVASITILMGMRRQRR